MLLNSLPGYGTDVYIHMPPVTQAAALGGPRSQDPSAVEGGRQGPRILTAYSWVRSVLWGVEEI